MSSCMPGQSGLWGFYQLSGELRFEAQEDPLDHESCWSATQETQGCKILGSSLSLSAGSWKIQVASGESYGSVNLSFLVKSLGSKDSSLTLKQVSPSIDSHRTDLSGSLVIFEIKKESQVLLSVGSLGKRKGGIVYPLGFLIQRLV